MTLLKSAAAAGSSGSSSSPKAAGSIVTRLYSRQLHYTRASETSGHSAPHARAHAKRPHYLCIYYRIRNIYAGLANVVIVEPLPDKSTHVLLDDRCRKILDFTILEDTFGGGFPARVTDPVVKGGTFQEWKFPEQTLEFRSFWRLRFSETRETRFLAEGGGKNGSGRTETMGAIYSRLCFNYSHRMPRPEESHSSFPRRLADDRGRHPRGVPTRKGPRRIGIVRLPHVLLI